MFPVSEGGAKFFRMRNPASQRQGAGSALVAGVFDPGERLLPSNLLTSKILLVA